MKKLILMILTVSIPLSLASCKTNTNSLPNSTSNSQKSYFHKPINGEVTDGNGFIGDNDDLIIDQDSKVYHDNSGMNQIGDTVQNIADDIGDSVKNITR